jgi:sulfatase maturation enzyme AslB (radical SAM superfamily)
MTKSCVLARHGLSIETSGNLLPCCQFRERPHDGHKSYTIRDYSQWRVEMDSLAADLDAGIEDPRCYQCWYDENLGYSSLRTTSNKRHGDAANTDPWHVEFKLGNFCNLRCIMCSPYSSSSIWSEFIQNKAEYNSVGVNWSVTSSEHKWWDSDAFKEFYLKVLPTVTYLHFTGGEPFMVPGLVDILSSVPDPPAVELLFVTNMTTINDATLLLLKKFKSVNFVISLEGTGKQNDYIRFGSDFLTIENNLKKVKSVLNEKLELGVNHTFQHTSIYSLPALIDWCCIQNIELHFSLHGGEEYMRINSVPPADMARFKDQIEQSLTVRPDVKSYVLNVIKDYQYDSELNDKFRRYTNMIDGIRGNNYNLTFDPAN